MSPILCGVILFANKLITFSFFPPATNYDDIYHLLPDCLLDLLAHHDGDDLKFRQHLDSVKLLDLIPYDLWFKGCFAGVIPAIALDRIWDKGWRTRPEDDFRKDRLFS